MEYNCDCPCACCKCACPYLRALCFAKQLIEAGVSNDVAAELATKFVSDLYILDTPEEV